jgi:integrase
MKQCEWCDHEMMSKNFRRHQTKCLYKNEVGVKKSDMVYLKENRPKEVESEETKKLQLAFMELKHYLLDSYQKTNNIYTRIITNDQRDAVDRLREMHVSDITKYNYVCEWKLYKNYIDKKKLPPGRDSANTYLSTLKCRASTLRRKQCMMQNMLRFLIDPSVKLNRVSTRINFVPKYPLSDKEINDYLKEQKALNYEDYLVQRLLITYGLRINSVSSLKKKHLIFLDDSMGKKIFIPDSKVKKERIEDIDDDLANELRKIVRGDSDEEQHIFLRYLDSSPERKRAQHLCSIINKCIKDSKIIKKNPNFQYSSHMFRKTKAYNIFQNGVNELKAQARRALGQTENSQAIESYIN